MGPGRKQTARTKSGSLQASLNNCFEMIEKLLRWQSFF